MIAPYLASSLVNRFKPENESQYKLIKDANSIRRNKFWINTSIPVTLYGNMVTFRDSNESSKREEDLLKTKTNYKFNVTDYNQLDKKLIYEFRKDMKFDAKQKERKIPSEISLMSMLESPAILASGISSIF